MFAAVALMLASPDIFLRTQVQGWTVESSVLSCRAEKKITWDNKIAILKAKDDTASMFLQSSYYGSDFFGDIRVLEPKQTFDIYFAKSFAYDPGWMKHRAEAMRAEGRIEMMTVVPFAELVQKSAGEEKMIFIQGEMKSANFLITGMTNALELLDKCSKTLR